MHLNIYIFMGKNYEAFLITNKDEVGHHNSINFSLGNNS